MCSQENPEEGVIFKGALESKLSFTASPSPTPRRLSSTRIQNLKNLEGTFSPTGSGMTGHSATHSTEASQRDSRARTQSADMPLLRWTWLLRETEGDEGTEAQGPVVSHGHVLTGTESMTKTVVASLLPCRTTGCKFLSPLKAQNRLGEAKNPSS